MRSIHNPELFSFEGRAKKSDGTDKRCVQSLGGEVASRMPS